MISVFFYLRVVVMMYMSDQPATAVFPPMSTVGIAALVAAAVVIVALGILPTPVLNFAAESIATIF